MTFSPMQGFSQLTLNWYSVHEAAHDKAFVMSLWYGKVVSAGDTTKQITQTFEKVS